MECDICKNLTSSKQKLYISGEDGLYIFDVCEKCHDIYSSDVYSIEDILGYKNKIRELNV